MQCATATESYSQTRCGSRSFFFASVAQVAEHRPCKSEVAESTPAAGFSGSRRMHTMTDVMKRNSENGQWELTSEKDVVEDYLSEKYNTTLDEVVSVYTSVKTSWVGRLLYGN